MRLLRPDLTAWLLAVPVAAACWFLHYHYKWQQRRTTDGVPRVRALSRRSGRRHDAAVLTFSILTIALLVAAMTRPQLAREARTPEFERQDLVLIVDRSASMRARDVRPSRFGRAADEIRTFLQRKPEAIDRVALVGFAAGSVVLSYPTRDAESLLFYLDWARDDPTPLFGTNLGAALTSALAVSRQSGARIPAVFVVVSDGEDQGSQLDRALAAVSRRGIRVHAIGIGSHESVPMPVPTGDGREEFLRDDAGRLMRTRFTESTLQHVAAATGGRYFRPLTGGELLAALESIVGDERRQVGWTTRTEYRDVYRLVLGAAAVAALCLVVLLL